MLFRVAGKLADNRSFSIRVESENALDASASVKQGLQAQGIKVTDIRQIVTKPVAESSTLYIGEARAPRAKRSRKTAK